MNAQPTRRQRLAEAKAAYNHPVYAKMAFAMGCGVQGRGAGSRVWDDEDHRSFLALFDQYGNQSFGYGHEQIVGAIRDQLDSGRLNSTKIMFEREQILLCSRLAALTGGRLPYSYLANGGGESIDNALKLARAATRRPRFITAVDCFHGKTIATLSASGRAEHEAAFSPLISEFTQVPFGDLAALERELDERAAAVLLEPVQAEGGVIVPPPHYLREVRRLCDEAGALLILDEMQTAFGRCGSFFAFEQFGVLPDLLCIGKAFGGGMLPISAVLGTEAVWGVLRELPSAFGSSLGGNPLSCRVGLETVRIASDPGFLTAVRDKGRRISDRLGALAKQYPRLIREHRGLGMMHGIEFFDEATAGLVLALLLGHGVTSTYSLYRSSVLRVQPPLVISAEDLDEGLDALARSLAEADLSRASGISADGGPPRPVRYAAKLRRSAEEVLALLRDRPRMFDPFARDNDAPDGPPTARLDGVLGSDAVVWGDRVEHTPDGVRLIAEPDWMWSRLEREAAVRPDPRGSGCEVRILVDWDTGTGAYEDLLSGRIGHFVTTRLTELAARAAAEE